MAKLLSGTAFITGAGSGIGQYTSYAFAAQGVTNLALADISAPNLESTVSELRARHGDSIAILTLTMDTANEGDVEAGIAATIDRFGALDIAVNNAGIGGSGQMSHELERETFQRVLDINLTGVWMCQKAELRQMLKQEVKDERRGRGCIVNTASMLGLIASAPATLATAYTASKHGVMGLTKTDAIMYAKDKIRINAMCPGYVGTPLLRSATVSEVMKPEVEKTPMGRMGTMEEIADCITFLASPMASFMTGHGLVADGGYTVG